MGLHFQSFFLVSWSKITHILLPKRRIELIQTAIARIFSRDRRFYRGKAQNN
jgi:hypothetical protein